MSGALSSPTRLAPSQTQCFLSSSPQIGLTPYVCGAEHPEIKALFEGMYSDLSVLRR